MLENIVNFITLFLSFIVFIVVYIALSIEEEEWEENVKFISFSEDLKKAVLSLDNDAVVNLPPESV